jgi:DEAD/DEAH box helicase domain-containing protein
LDKAGAVRVLDVVLDELADADLRPADDPPGEGPGPSAAPADEDADESADEDDELVF